MWWDLLGQRLHSNPWCWDWTRCEIVRDALQFRKLQLHSSHQIHFPDDPSLFSAGSFHFSISRPGMRSWAPRGPVPALALREVSILSWPCRPFELGCCIIGLHVMFLLAHGVTFVQTEEALWFWGKWCCLGWCLAFRLSESLLGQLHSVLVKSNHTNECEDARSDAKSSVDITVLFMIFLQFIDPYLHFDDRLRECHSLFVKIPLISQAPNRGVKMA